MRAKVGDKMLESAWLFIGFIALSTTAVAVITKTKGAALFPNDDAVAIYSGLVGFVSWAIWTYGTLNVEVVSNGSIQAFSMPAVTFFGLAMATIPGFIALTGPVSIARRAMDNPTADDI
jgi:hypothetical protein